MMDSLPAAIYLTDAEGALVYFNPAAAELSGHVPQLGTTHWCVSWKLFNPDGTPLPHDECPMAVSLRERRPIRGVEAIAERPDGTRVWFQPYPTPIFDHSGQLVGGINLLQDISERKQAETAQLRLVSIVQSSGDAIISKDLKGTIASWNPGAERIFGYTAEEAIGNPITMLFPSDRIEEEASILERMRRGERVEHYETVRRRKCGTLIHVSLCISPLLSSRGEIIGVSKIARDITAQVRARDALTESEKRLKDLSQDLETQVAERTRELREKNIRLRDLASQLTTAELRERKRLAALLHDDLQQSLVAVKMQLSVLSRRVDKAHSGAVEKSVQLLGDAINCAHDLTRELRPPALYEHGLLAALRWLASQMWDRYSLRVRVTGGETAEASSDDVKALLYQCARELLFNVVKHANVDEADVELSTEDGRCVVVVKDRGCGFDSAVDQGPGGGCGLFGIRERLATYGGSFSIDSREGEGTTAEVILPLFPPDDVHGSEPKAGTRVLLVDDHTIVREGIIKILGSDERISIVGEAKDGLEAIDLVHALLPDVVLLDVNMPRMNGLDAARVIRRSWPQVRIVGLSVQDDEMTEKAMIAAGAERLLLKSSDPQLIVSVVLNSLAG